MARLSVLAACTVLVVISTSVVGQFLEGTFAQNMFPAQTGFNRRRTNGWGPIGNNNWNTGNLFGRRLQRYRYQTCVGKNTNGDEMRITISIADRFRFQFNFLNAPRVTDNLVRLSVEYKSPASSLQGQYQLVVTEFSRVEDGCSSQALGDIINDPQRRWAFRPRGILGNPVTISRGQNAMSSEIIENMRFEEFNGRGLAMCPARQISGTKCLDIIPLCCKIGHDQQSASVPIRPAGQMFGMQNGMGVGMGMGMNRGLNQNMGMNMNSQLNPGLQAGANNMGVNSGMNNAFVGGNTGGNAGNQGAPLAQTGGVIF